MPAPLIAAAAMALMQMGNGVQQAGLIRQGAAIQDKIDDINANFLDHDAFEAENFGLLEANRMESKNNQVYGSAEVANAANGVDSSYGTAGELKKQNHLTGFLNIMDVQNQAHARALGIKREAMNARLGQAITQLDLNTKASDAQSQGVMSGISTLGGAAANKYGYTLGKG